MKTKQTIKKSKEILYKLMELSYRDIPVRGNIGERIKKAIRLIVYKRIMVFEWR